MAQADSVPSAVRALITDAGPKPSTPVQTAYAEFSNNLAEYPPQSAPAHPHDSEQRPNHLAVSVYLVLDTKQNVAGRLDLIDGRLSEPVSRVIGTLQKPGPRSTRRVA